MTDLRGNGTGTCAMHPVVEDAIERIETMLDDYRRDVGVIAREQTAVRLLVQQSTDHLLALAQRFDDWARSHDRVDEIRREDGERRLRALEAESDQWREDTQSQSREALTTRAKRAENHVETLASELRKERDLAAKREEQLTEELRLERARRDSLRVHGEVAATARWKIWGAVALGVVGSLTAIVQAIVGR